MPATRVIVVDDHPESRQTLVHALDAVGHASVGAPSADEALAACARERFACMLLDEVLGDDSGLALAGRLHGQPLRPARILMVSGLAREFFEEALREGLIDGFLEKPVGLGELLDAVEAAVGAERPRGKPG